jgi:hypothetical protein
MKSKVPVHCNNHCARACIIVRKFRLRRSPLQKKTTVGVVMVVQAAAAIIIIIMRHRSRHRSTILPVCGVDHGQIDRCGHQNKRTRRVCRGIGPSNPVQNVFRATNESGVVGRASPEVVSSSPKLEVTASFCQRTHVPSLVVV